MTGTSGRQKFIIDQAIGQIDRFEERSSEIGAIDTGEALALIDRVRGVLGGKGAAGEKHQNRYRTESYRNHSIACLSLDPSHRWIRRAGRIRPGGQPTVGGWAVWP